MANRFSRWFMRLFGKGAPVIPVVRLHGVIAADLDLIQRAAHAIVIHAPLTKQTHHLIDDAFIARLELSPVIVNVPLTFNGLASVRSPAPVRKVPAVSRSVPVPSDVSCKTASDPAVIVVPPE